MPCATTVRGESKANRGKPGWGVRRDGDPYTPVEEGKRTVASELFASEATVTCMSCIGCCELFGVFFEKLQIPALRRESFADLLHRDVVCNVVDVDR